jgi:hypothetical protein
VGGSVSPGRHCYKAQEVFLAWIFCYNGGIFTYATAHTRHRRVPHRLRAEGIERYEWRRESRPHAGRRRRQRVFYQSRHLWCIGISNGILSPFPPAHTTENTSGHPSVARERCRLSQQAGGSLSHRLAARCGAALRGLDRRLRMGEGRASGVYQGRGPRDGPAGKAGRGPPCLWHSRKTHLIGSWKEVLHPTAARREQTPGNLSASNENS